MTNTQVQASVIGGRDERDYDMDKLSPTTASFRAHEKYIDSSKDGFAGIKVTTFVTQESIAHQPENDETGSTKDLVHKHSF
jgi:FMN-dependent NADH-azoreductase